MLAFLLDIVKVPEVSTNHLHFFFTVLLMIFESHTGVVLANTFQEMLERFGLEEKVKSFFFFISNQMSNTIY